VPTTLEIATMQSLTAAPTPFVRGRLPRTLSGPSSLPPRKNAKPWKTVIVGASHETKMHCVKRLGQRLMARGFD